MDGITKYLTTLGKINDTICELGAPVIDVSQIHFPRGFKGDVFEYEKEHPELDISTPLSSYMGLLDVFSQSLIEIQSLGMRASLEECVSSISLQVLQTRLDNLSWRDFVSLGKGNLRNFYKEVQGNLNIYISRGLLSKKVADALLFNIWLAGNESDGRGNFPKGKMRGGIPKAIRTLADTAQKYGYSFNKGTFLYELLVGYGDVFVDKTSTKDEQKQGKYSRDLLSLFHSHTDLINELVGKSDDEKAALIKKWSNEKDQYGKPFIENVNNYGYKKKYAEALYEAGLIKGSIDNFRHKL